MEYEKRPNYCCGFCCSSLFFFGSVFLRSNIQFDFQVVFYKVGYAVGAIKCCHYYGPAGKNESLGVLLLSPAAALALRRLHNITEIIQSSRVIKLHEYFIFLYFCYVLNLNVFWCNCMHLFTICIIKASVCLSSFYCLDIWLSTLQIYTLEIQWNQCTFSTQ